MRQVQAHSGASFKMFTLFDVLSPKIVELRQIVVVFSSGYYCISRFLPYLFIWFINGVHLNISQKMGHDVYY